MTRAAEIRALDNAQTRRLSPFPFMSLRSISAPTISAVVLTVVVVVAPFGTRGS